MTTKIFFPSLLLGLSAALSAVAQTPPPSRVALLSGLVSHYSAENNAQDSTGTNNGTLVNGTGFAAGQVGQAFNLNSSASNHVRISDSTSLRPNTLTMEGWVNFNATNLGHAQIIFGKAVGTQNYNSYVLWYQDGALHGATGNPTNLVRLDYPWQPALGAWYHVAYSYDGSSHLLYVNGVQVATAADNQPPGYDAHDVLIGGDLPGDVNSAPIDFFDGKLDELSLYSRALTATEIQSIYNAGSSPVTLPLTTGSGNKLDLGAYAGGEVLALVFTGSGDLTDNRLTCRPDGNVAIPASGSYSFANQGAAYPAQDGGDGINHFAGGGQNFDATGSGYTFAGKLTTNTTDRAAVRGGAVVATFASSPARADWIFIGTGAVLQVPAGGAHLYLAVNDSFSGDNHGAYNGTLTIGGTFPPPAPVHGGLAATIFTVNESESPSQPAVDSILRFRAAQNGTPANLLVRVQSSTDYNPGNPAAATWTFLPDGLSGAMAYTPQVTGYTLASTNYPPVNGVFFRAVSSAPAYGETASNVVGPFNLQSAAAHLAAPVLLVATNTGHSAVRFGVTEATIPVGISVRIQTSQTPVDQGSWADAPIGVGSSAGLMTQDSADPHQFYLGTDIYPPVQGVYFRAVAGAVASGYVASPSVIYGPFEIVNDPPATVHIQVNGVQSQRNDIDGGYLLPASGSFDMSATATSGRFLKGGITLLYDGVIVKTSGEGASSVQLPDFRTNIPGDHVLEAYATDDLGVTGAADPIHVRILPNAPGKIFQMTHSGNWDVPANWIDIQGNPGIPGPNDFAIISTFNPILTGRDVTVKAMSLNGGTLSSFDQNPNVVHTLTVTGFCTIAGGTITSNLTIPSGSTCELLNDDDIALSGRLSYTGALRLHGKGGIVGVPATGPNGDGFFAAIGRLLGFGRLFVDMPSGGKSGSRATPAPPRPPAAPAVRPILPRLDLFPGAKVATVPAPSALIAAGAGNFNPGPGPALIAAGAGNALAKGVNSLRPPAQLIAAGAGNLQATPGSGLIAAGAGNLISQDGAGLVAAGAGNAPVGKGEKAPSQASDPAVSLSGGELDLDGLTVTGNVEVNSGVLSGSGMILGDLTNNGGFILPGRSSGVLAVTGTFSQGANGTLVVEDGGATPDGYDQLLIEGAANLGGNLILRTINGYTPDAADTFNPLGYTSVAGDFAAVSSDSQAVLTPSGVLVSLAPMATNPLTLTSVVSRKMHGGLGPFDIPLPLTGQQPGVECRSSGGQHTLVFTFSNNVMNGDASLTSGVGAVASTPAMSGNTLTVQLSGVADVQQIEVTLQGVVDEFGQLLPDTTVKMKALVGDTSGNGVVNGTDIAQVKSQSGAAVSGANFREDLNANGAISSSDTSLVKSRSGNIVVPGSTDRNN